MSKRALSFLIVFAMFITSAQIAAAKSDSDEVAIKILIANHTKVMNAGDADGGKDLFMPDGVFMPQGSPAQVGAKAIHAFEDTLFGLASFDINFDPVEVVVLNGWAFARVEVTGTWKSKDSRTSAKTDNKALFILHRTDAGTWKIARLMWNSNSEE
jgi:uncharacterized protein (TIGR02246 family)